MHQRYQRTALLIVDELGFVPFDRAGGELLFNLLSDRYERRSTPVLDIMPHSVPDAVESTSNVSIAPKFDIAMISIERELEWLTIG